MIHLIVWPHYLDLLTGGMGLLCAECSLCISVVDAGPSPLHPHMSDERCLPNTTIGPYERINEINCGVEYGTFL